MMGNDKKYIGKVLLEGKYGRMKLVDISENRDLKFIMLDENNRVQWTTDEYFDRDKKNGKFHNPFIAWFYNLFI